MSRFHRLGSSVFMIVAAMFIVLGAVSYNDAAIAGPAPGGGCTNCPAQPLGQDVGLACTGPSGTCPGVTKACPKCICTYNSLGTSQYCL